MKNPQDPNSAPSAEAGDAAGSTEAEAAAEASGARPKSFEEALDQIDALRALITEREEEVSKIRDQFLRERAELENFKKRMSRDKAESLRYASESLIRDLLPAMDNLARALAAATDTPDNGGEGLREGVAMVANQLDEILSRAGVAPVEAANRPFDPSEHEALAHVETTQSEPGNVLDEHLRGYRLHERLLRPAQVTVAKAPTNREN